jgi:hypothetical protein
MRSESAQASIEYIGVLLLVAALMGALVGAFGAPDLAARLASSVSWALVQAIGRSDGHGGVQPSAAELGMFDSAVDPKLPADDRPSLGDVRLQLIARHGDELGRELYVRMVLDNLRAVVPGLATKTRFATARSDVVTSRLPPSLQRIDVAQALSRPADGDPGEIETPSGRPNIHVVSVSDADKAIRRALNPGVSLVGVATDVVGAVPLGGVAVHLGKLAIDAEKAAAAAEYTAGWYAVARDGQALYADEASIPAGARAGDEVVTWTATRRGRARDPPRRFERSAVVRDSVVIFEGITPLDPGSLP